MLFIINVDLYYRSQDNEERKILRCLINSFILWHKFFENEIWLEFFFFLTMYMTYVNFA